MLKAHHKQTLALDLIKLKARISIIHEATGLSTRLLRDTYREFHGYSASSGASKESTQGLTRNSNMFKEATLFAVCYQTAEFKICEAGIRKVINAFDSFKKICPICQLDFSGGWVIAKDLRDRKVEITKCPHCESWVLLRARANQLERCGVCKKSL